MCRWELGVEVIWKFCPDTRVNGVDTGYSTHIGFVMRIVILFCHPRGQAGTCVFKERGKIRFPEGTNPMIRCIVVQHMVSGAQHISKQRENGRCNEMNPG